MLFVACPALHTLCRVLETRKSTRSSRTDPKALAPIPGAMNTIPNFDAMDPAELSAFWLKYRRPTRKDAEALIGDRRKGYTGLCGTLAGYAMNKATAMACRLKGDITAASIYEKCCDLAYERLPADLKW